MMHPRIDFSRMAPTVTFQKARTFPPKSGEWFQAQDTVVLGCLRCKNLYSVSPDCHTVLPDGRLQPSWICILCRSHTIVTLANYEAPPSPSSPTSKIRSNTGGDR